MNMIDIITKKRNGQELTKAEIDFFVKGYAVGRVPDYQAAALLMAIYLRGMSFAETEALTFAIRDSGKVISFDVPVCDKHSTGGVGDGTSLIVAPIVAACGGRVGMMAGRSLGHTGGTVDKLESIPGYNVNLRSDEFVSLVKRTGIAITGQSDTLAPADKRLYALRDVTATIDKIPLIAASIMGKKLAEGCSYMVLDVKCGSGAFMRNFSEAQFLANTLYSIAHDAGKKAAIIISDMESPLGNVIGNNLEVIQAIDVLRGRGPEDITAICLELSAAMLSLCGKGNVETCISIAAQALNDGSAFAKFKEMVANQGGNTAYIDKPRLFPTCKYFSTIKAKSNGFIIRQDAARYGEAARLLGAGRMKKDDVINPAAGIKLLKKVGDPVKIGENIAVLYYDDPELCEYAVGEMAEGTAIGKEKPEVRRLILKRIGDL